MKRHVSLLLIAAIAGPALAEPLDVTVKGQVREKVTIERVAPSTDVALKDVIPFSRLGQIDWILSEEIGYLD